MPLTLTMVYLRIRFRVQKSPTTQREAMVSHKFYNSRLQRTGTVGDEILVKSIWVICCVYDLRSFIRTFSKNASLGNGAVALCQ